MVGLGTMGRQHVRVLHDVAGAVPIAVADPSLAALANAVRGRELRPYLSHHEMLARERLDLAIIATPTSLHCEVAVDCLRAGVHVLIEKPIAANCLEARRIIDEARRSGRLVAIGHVERFNPAIVELSELLDRQELGHVFRLHARRLGPFPPRIRDVGVVIDLATHDIDIARSLLRSEPTRVYAETAQRIHTEHEDMLSALMRFDNNAVVLLDVNWLTPTKIRELSVTGEAGMFQVNYVTQELSFFENLLPDATVGEQSIVSVTEGKMVRFRVKQKEPLRAELEDMISAIADNRAPRVGPEDGYRALEIAEHIVRAGRSGEPLQVPAAVHAVLA